MHIGLVFQNFKKSPHPTEMGHMATYRAGADLVILEGRRGFLKLRHHYFFFQMNSAELRARNSRPKGTSILQYFRGIGEILKIVLSGLLQNPILKSRFH